MRILLDTSVLGRLANFKDADFPTATAAVAKLASGGQLLFITPQNLIEFRNFATRSKAQNGLGLTAQAAAAVAAQFEATFHLLPDTPDVYPACRAAGGRVGGDR